MCTKICILWIGLEMISKYIACVCLVAIDKKHGVVSNICEQMEKPVRIQDSSLPKVLWYPSQFWNELGKWKETFDEAT